MAQVKYQSFAGVTLSINPPDLQLRMDRLLPYTDFKSWDAWNFQGYDLQKLPTPSLPTIPPLEPGVLYWPSGATRPAWFFQVVTQTQLDAIRAAITCETSTYPLVLQDGRTGKKITAQMYMLPARPINQLGSTSRDGWLLTLTDQRFYWHWKTGSISTKPASWSALYNAIAAILGIGSLEIDTVASAYGVPSKKWIGYTRPPATVLDAIAAQVNQRIVVSLDGTVSTVNWQTAKTASDEQVASLHLIAGGEVATQDIARYVPRAMTTAFADWSNGGLADAPFVTTRLLTSLFASGLSEYEGLCSGIDATGLIYADFSYSGANTTAVSAFATQASVDWYGWRLSDTELSIAGIEPFSPTGWEDSIEWVSQLRDYGPAIMTRIRRGAWSNFPSGTYTGDNPAPVPPPHPPAPPPSSDCSNILGNIRASKCGTLILGPGAGICDCIDLQTAPLTWNSTHEYLTSTTKLYGCTPGVITTNCPNGAPRKFVTTISGFTGDCANLNGTWTLTHDTGSGRWTQNKGGGLSGQLIDFGSGDWGLDFDNGVATPTFTVSGVVGCCAPMTFAPDDTGGCDSTPLTITVTPATSCGLGTAYYPVLDICDDSCGRPAPRLRLVPVTASGNRTITFSNVGCETDSGGSSYVEFSSSDPLICTDLAADGCGDNSVRARFTCRPCNDFVKKFVLVPCLPCCAPLTGITVVDIPNTLYATFTVISGPDTCPHVGGMCRTFTLTYAPAAKPLANCFTGFDTIAGYTVLPAGSTIANLTQNSQCAVSTTGPSLIFNGGSGAVPQGYNINCSGGMWTITWNGATHTLIADEDAQTVTFNVPVGFESYWGGSTVVFTLGGMGRVVWSDTSELTSFGGPYGYIEIAFCVASFYFSTDLHRNPSVGDSGICVSDSFPSFSGPCDGEQYYARCLIFSLGTGFSGFCSIFKCEDTTVSFENDTLYSINVSCTPGMDCTHSTPTYNCANGSCIDPGDGTGEFRGPNALQECLVNCGGGGGGGPTTDCGTNPGVPPLNANLVVVGGPGAGSYSAPWQAGSPNYVGFSDVGFPPGVGTPTFEFFAGAWHMITNPGGVVQDETATGGSCGAACNNLSTVTFAGTTIGASSVTLTFFSC